MSESKSDYIDAPSFYNWLITERPSLLREDGKINASKLTSKSGRGIHRWKREGATVDKNSRAFEEIMMVLDLQEWEIPVEFDRQRWVSPGPKIRQKTHEKIIRLYAEGKTITEIAKATRVSRTSVRRHIEQL